MNNIDSIINTFARVSAPKRNPGDYEKDGILYCGKCHTPKQCVIDWGGERVVGCTCSCEQEENKAKIDQLKRQERMLEIENLRTRGIRDEAVQNFTFANSDRSKRILECKRYVDMWPEVLKNNGGLLFWGDTETGKTFAAACIANELISRGVPALVTSFHAILNIGGWEKGEVVQDMKQFPLLVIDDLGAERQNSEYALEIVEYVIDERYKTKKPLIVTTNLTRNELEHPINMGYKRVYSRILEMCTPVEFNGKHYRKEKAREKMSFVREVFG